MRLGKIRLIQFAITSSEIIYQYFQRDPLIEFICTLLKDFKTLNYNYFFFLQLSRATFGGEVRLPDAVIVLHTKDGIKYGDHQVILLALSSH